MHDAEDSVLISEKAASLTAPGHDVRPLNAADARDSQNRKFTYHVEGRFASSRGSMAQNTEDTFKLFSVGYFENSVTFI